MIRVSPPHAQAMLIDTPFRVILLLFVLLLTGCANLGPRALEAGRADYNTVLRDTSDQQLLKNLVRLRYLERPYFLEVASVTSQFSFSGGVGAGLAFDGLSVDDDVPVDIEGSYEEAPTVAYQPLQGEDFVRRLLAPISIDALALLARSGWSIERLLRVCVQRANDLGNAVTASGPTPADAPEFEAFLEMARSARLLQQQDQISLTLVADEAGRPQLSLVVTHGGEGTAAFQRLAELLELSRERTRFYLGSGLWQRDGGTVDVQTRSLNGILYYLSHGVEIPEAHRRAGYVRETQRPDGGRFDWSELTARLIRVQSGEQAPKAAAVRIRHRGYWYWIADDDLDSKTTFSLLAQLLALQSGDAATTGPVLTLPVGG